VTMMPVPDIQFATRRQSYSVHTLVNRLSVRASQLVRDRELSEIPLYAADFKAAFEDEVNKMAKEEFDRKGNR
jgi:uncharacterized protein with gpF-like domain